jgi:hypothetical protein
LEQEQMSAIYTAAAWGWMVMAFAAGVIGIRKSIRGKSSSRTQQFLRICKFCASVCFLLAATAVMAAAIVKMATR